MKRFRTALLLANGCLSKRNGPNLSVETRGTYRTNTDGSKWTELENLGPVRVMSDVAAYVSCHVGSLFFFFC